MASGGQIGGRRLIGPIPGIDRRPGQAHGQGVLGKWFAATPSLPTGPTGTSTAPTTSGGSGGTGGYNY